MDYIEYDRIQADLGAVSDFYRENCDKLINSANTDPETLELVNGIRKATESAFFNVSLLVSRVARLLTK